MAETSVGVLNLAPAATPCQAPDPAATNSARRRRQPTLRGVWIALYGPDGAGKSAVAELAAKQLSGYFAAIHRHHLRIPLRRRNAVTSPVVRPHDQRPRSGWLSCLKLIYLFATCWLSYRLVMVPRLAAGHLVIFDRYFPDHAVDLRRYRLSPASLPVAALLARWIPKPDLQIVLDAPTEVLLGRKREIGCEELHRQRDAYRRTIGSGARALITDATRPLPEVAGDVSTAVLVRLAGNAAQCL